MGCDLWSLCYKCKMPNLVIRTWVRLSFKIVQTYLYISMLSKVRTQSLESFFIDCNRIQIWVSCYPLKKGYAPVSIFLPYDLVSLATRMKLSLSKPQETSPWQFCLAVRSALCINDSYSHSAGNSVRCRGPAGPAGSEWTLDQAGTNRTLPWKFRSED